MTMNNNIPPKAPNERYTDAQWQAIYDGGDNLLVSASAGSGKTAVLVRRVIEKIKREQLSVDQLLVVTFTEAAAAEMKERIQQALQEAINEETNQEQKQHFVRQLTLLPTANISTLHSFCSKVIQRFFYLIDLDPSYRMLADVTETILLKEDVWDELREECYEEDQHSFYQLTENFSNDRGDAGLEELILSLYDFARANPAPFEWLDSLIENYQIDELVQSSFYQKNIRPRLIDSLQNAQKLYDLLRQTSEVADDLNKITELANAENQQVEQMLQAVRENELNEVYQAFSSLKFVNFPAYRGEKKELYSDSLEKMKSYRQQAKDVLTNIQEQYFSVSPEEQVVRLQEALPLIEELVQVEKMFIQRYSAKKREKSLLDFNDLEHFALQILLQEVEGQRPAERYYQEKFVEILVDEYQDTNQLQETILQHLSAIHQGNLFMVGDVKQSIYGFRLADPTLFIRKYHAFGEEQNGRRIILAENFRSRKEVLDFTNLVFKQLMDSRVGQIEYDQKAELSYGFAQFPDSEQFQTELLVYEKKEETPEWIEDKSAGEIFMVASKIRELIDSGFEIYDKKHKRMRPLRYEDIVLLTPTKGNNLTILEIFKQLNIPLSIQDTQNYFQSTELRVMISLLQIIDNPYQDIPLVAVLRSPIVGLNEEELANIRLALPNQTFYQATLAYVQHQEDSISEKLTKFYQLFDRWREFARRESLANVLLKIYDETAYLDYVQGMPAGQQRKANLLALVERGKEYERSSFRGLYQFIRFIEKMQEKEKDLAEPQSREITDAVRVMTIHASKGLEFPLVFLMDMSKSFNLTDTTKRYVFDEELGLGVKLLTPTTRVQLDTIIYTTVQQKKINKLLSEEMRKLYVALTRAEQKLYLVGSYDDQAAAFKKWSLAASNEQLVLDSHLREKRSGTFFDWVGQTLFRHPLMGEIQHVYEVSAVPELQKDTSKFQVTFIKPNDLAEKLAAVTPISSEKSATREVTSDSQALLKRLAFQYPYPEATKTASYQSVSELKRLYDDPDNRDDRSLDLAEINKRKSYRFTTEDLNRPKFLEVQKLSAAEIGTATHLVMQLLPLNKVPTLANVTSLIQELVARDTLTQEISERISVESILAFFASDLGQLILANPTNVFREEPFASLFPAQEIFREYPSEDELLVHGIIDGYVEFADHLVLYDFKTDEYHEQRRQRLLDRYRGQMYLYKEALEEAKQKPVVSANLVFLQGFEVIDLLKETKN